MIRLHVNIDHVATLRNQRDTSYPDPVEAARLCLGAGADGITVHLREDRRHIRDRDVERLRAEVDCLLNLEMAASSEMAAIVERIRPQVVTLVPERREERTTEGGLDVIAGRDAVLRVAEACARVGTKLSLFIEANVEQIRASREVGAQQIEIHTGHYCEDPLSKRGEWIERFSLATRAAHELGLEVAAGHGLNVENVEPVARLEHMAELNIGHSIICDAVFVGLPAAVQRMRAAVDAAIGRG